MKPRRSRPVPVIQPSAFVGFRFPPEIIALAVSWYLRYGLSYRDVEELLAERGIEVDHVTIYRWVQGFTPLLADAAGRCRHAVGDWANPAEGDAMPLVEVCLGRRFDAQRRSPESSRRWTRAEFRVSLLI